MATMVQEFGKTGVLYGGSSAERPVSLSSGNAVLQGLQTKGVDAVGIDLDFAGNIYRQLEGIDRAFIVLHGRGGEDGIIQAILETMKIPYTGSGVMASAIGMNKLQSKRVWQGSGIPTPRFVAVRDEMDLGAGYEALGGGILMVKPMSEGSSIGMSRVASLAELSDAFRKARQYDDEVLLEEWIDGDEYTCTVVGDEAYPVVKLETPNEYYDYAAKYEANDTRYLCPCGLPEPREEQLKALALEGYRLIGCTGWGRVDVMMDNRGDFFLLEVNTVPGMTDHSLVPMAAKARGIGFNDLVWNILETTLGR